MCERLLEVAQWQMKCGEKLNVDSDDRITTILAVGSWDFNVGFIIFSKVNIKKIGIYTTIN